MNPRQPTTVRLTPKATAALIGLEEKRPGTPRAKIVEEALEEAATTANRLPISAEERSHVRFIQRYLYDEAIAHHRGAKRQVDRAGQIALAAMTAAGLLHRVFMEAEGRIAITKK